MASDSVTIACPAKVNLALSVAALDHATGMHPLSSWMVAVDLCDTLTVRRLADGDASRFAIAFAPDAPRAQEVDWPLERDLAVCAHAAVEAATGRTLPVDLALHKRIPCGGGLGGGSSDAAGVLVAMDKLFDSPLEPEALHTIARGLGSDVPFALAALSGTPSAAAGGTGEVIHPAPTPGGHLVLVMPPFGCDTAAVYRAFDQHAPPSRPQDTSELIDLARRAAPESFFNDLARPAMLSHPPLADVFDNVAQHAGRRAHVSGSGSTCFVVAQDHAEAQSLARELEGLEGCVTRAVRYPLLSATA